MTDKQGNDLNKLLMMPPRSGMSVSAVNSMVSGMLRDSYHSLVIGTSGQGKSALLQAEARRLGITYEELLQRLEPSEEQKEQRMRQEKEDSAENQRLTAVREAFWHNTPEGHHDLSQLHDVLVVSDIVEEPTAAQIKAFFMMLPADIIGSALSWGFGDTEVRERTYEFVEQNKQAVIEAVSSELEN